PPSRRTPPRWPYLALLGRERPAVIDFINARPSPLGLYVFAEDQRVAEQILGATPSGDAAVKECTIQPLIHS
ncbi:MAG TPA: hypothetical protein VG013_20040, partial [Gemmataceae bacterium]|nr:hypothetical protein [Gemmataceae bacterium]